MWRNLQVKIYFYGVKIFLDVIYQFTLVMSIVVEISLFCHSERSEESVSGVTMAVCHLLVHFPCSVRAVLCYFLTGHSTKVYILNDFMS